MTKEWEPLKEDIRKLYKVEDKTLDEVMRIMKGKFGFIASKRAYQNRLRDWGYIKYNTEAFPKPIKKTRLSARSRTRPALSYPEGFSLFQNESSLVVNSPAFSALNSSRNDMQFLASAHSALEASGSHISGFGQDTRALVSGYSDKDDQDSEGKTQLHRSASNGDHEQMRSLLEAGAAVDIQDHMGRTPLHYAVTAGYGEIVDLLLRFGAEVDAKASQGAAPLHLAVYSLSLTKKLLDQGAFASIQDDRGDTPLHWILRRNHPTISEEAPLTIKSLLQSRADVNKTNHMMITPFHEALKKEYVGRSALEVIQSFLQSGGSIHLPLPDGRTPLEIFLSQSNRASLYNSYHTEYDILSTFLAKGASVITPTPTGEPLILNCCSWRGWSWERRHASKKRLFNCITAEEAKNIGDQLLLELAANHTKEPDKELIKILLHHGADPNCENSSGQTPLILLMIKSRVKVSVITSMLASLLKYGADPWKRDVTASCPLVQVSKIFPQHGLVLMMLKEDLRRETNLVGSEMVDRDASRSKPWSEWRQAIRAVDWVEVKRLIFREPEDPTDGVTDEMRESALRLLAENHVRLVKDKFKADGGDTEHHRRYVASILRDCSERGITLDKSCADYLIELCL